MSRHGDCRGQIAAFRGSFETINWLYLHIKCGIKTKTHFEWLLWHWSSLCQLTVYSLVALWKQGSEILKAWSYDDIQQFKCMSELWSSYERLLGLSALNWDYKRAVAELWLTRQDTVRKHLDMGWFVYIEIVVVTGERFLLNCCNSTRPCKLLQHNIAVIKEKYTADQSAKHLCPNHHHGGRNPHLPLASFGSLAPRLSPFLWPVMTRKQTDVVVLRGKCAQWIFCGRGFIPVFGNLG